MPQKAVAVIAAVLCLLTVSEASILLSNLDRFDVTQYFSFTTNSTCGDPPTSFEVDGEVFNCTSGEHEPEFAVDGDNETWWQAATGDSTVELLFTLQEAALSLQLLEIRLTPRALSPPLRFLIEARGRGQEDFTLLHVYTLNVTTFCDEFIAQGVPCSDIIDTIVDGEAVIDLSDSPMPIEELRMIADGFLNSDVPQYRSMEEIVLLGWIADGYFVRSVHDIFVEGEEGVEVNSLQTVATGTDESQFPEFQGRGYAALEYDAAQRVMVQWLIPSLPRDTTYQLLFRYIMLGDTSQRLIATVMQGDRTYETRVTLMASCDETCYAFFSDTIDVNTPALLDLSQGPLSIIITLSSVNILLDSIIAVPQEFYDPTTLDDSARFLLNCDVTGNFDMNTDTEFCDRSAVQLSTEFYVASFPCNCRQPGSTGSECWFHGGQCSCIPASNGFAEPNGRQCDICPFFSYITPQGCAACTCPNPLDECDQATGQCQDCPPLVEGLSCNSCVDDSFGDPNVGCEPCMCNSTGSDFCNQTTGECICMEGVTGVSCDRCAEGAFNFSSLGCTECMCAEPGSEGIDCDDTGQCQCKFGVGGGPKCSECLPGFFFLSDTGCTQCNCSGRSSDCEQDSFVSSEPSEVCSCPFPYIGRSCENCFSLGFFFSSLLGDCAPCQCNGRADTCESGDGICINCTNNTVGDSCEVCAEGYFDADPRFNDLSCLECPCNTITAFNASCSPDSNGDPVCFCRPGHDGPLCDTCSNAFFGQPPEFRCTQCDCNGNIDLTVPGSCDTTTGVCLLCINNSTGPECELCAPGFFGDATMQACTECECSLAGSATSLCDSSSGQCSCLPGVVGGQVCDACMPGFWNFTAGVGCELCDCGVGSTSGECDVATGACSCNQGITGDDCSVCQDGFFNFSAAGCTSCGCGIGASSVSCTAEGQCFCQPGVVGEKCDVCDAFHNNLTELGCEPCGECEQMLRADLTTANSELQLAENGINLFESLFQADINGFAEISSLEEGVSDDILLTNETLIVFQGGLQDLNVTIEALTAMADAIQVRITRSTQTAIDLSPYASDVFEYIQEVYNSMEDVLISIGEINRFVMDAMDAIASQEQEALNIEGNITEIASQHAGNFSNELAELQDLLAEAMALNAQALNYLAIAQYQRNVSDRLDMTYEGIVSNTTSLSDELERLIYELEQIDAAIDMLSTSTDQLESVVNAINATVEYATNAIDTAETVVDWAQSTLTTVRDETIPALESLIGITQLASGSGMDLGSGSSSLDSDMPTIVEGIAELRSDIDNLENNLIECVMVVNVACDYAVELENLAGEIESILQPSLTAGNAAVAAILDFSNATNMIEMALNLTEQTNITLQNVLRMIDMLMTDELQEQVSYLLDQSNQLLISLRSLQDMVASLLISVTDAEMIVERADQLSGNISALESDLETRVNQLEIATGMTVSDVGNNLESIDQNTRLVNETFEYISSVLPIDTSESIQLLNQTEELNDDADALLDIANETVQETAQAYDRRHSRLTEIAVMADLYENELNDMEEQIIRLRSARDVALQAVASIDVALRFFGNSSLSYQLPQDAESSSSFSVSLIFRPSDVSTGLLLATIGSQGLLDGVSLQLNNGSVEAEYASDNVTVRSPMGSLTEEEWYQLYATRERDRAQLSVAPLRGGMTYTATVDMAPHLTPEDLPPGNASILLGGHPLYEGYSGCVDRVVLNNVQLSLLLPEPLTDEIATCGPRPPAETARVFENGVWFQGGGSHVVVAPPSLTSSMFDVEFTFRTLSESGLLIQVFSDNMARQISIFLSGGRVAMELSAFNWTRIETVSTFNTGLWYTVRAEVTQMAATLVVNGTEMVATDMPSLIQPFNTSGELFVGGLTPTVQELIMSGQPSFAGCLRDFQINSEPVDLQDNLDNARVSFDGCPASVVSGVRFMGDGLALFAVEPDEQVQTVSFSFRTTQLVALLLQLETEIGPLSVSVYHTKVRVELGDTVLLSDDTALNDNRWHDVTITAATNAIGNSTIELDVDGASTYSADIEAVPSTGAMLTVGGTTNITSSIVAESFRGCLDYLMVNGRTLDFNDAEVLEGVALFGCRPASSGIPSPPPPPPLPPPPSLRPNITVGLDGNDGSFVALLISEEELIDIYLIELEFQTVESLEDVLLLYTQGTLYADYMALELQAGQLVYSYNLGTGRVYITSSGTYNDGEIHTVELYRSAQFGEMVVDGSDRANDTSPGAFTALNINTGLLFVGGTPLIIPPTSLLWPGIDAPSSALACFHAFSINGIYYDLRFSQASNGAGQCLATYNNLATFGEDSFLQLFENFYAGVDLTISLDFSTTRCSGLLVYVASAFHPDHLLLELFDGTVRFVFDNGPGEVVVEYTPVNSSDLCDRNFHTLELRKEGVVGTLFVDGTLAASARSPNSESNFVAINTNDPLYLGGVPAGTPTRFNSLADSFQGCLSNVFVQQGADGERESVILAQAEDFENVSFNSCSP